MAKSYAMKVRPMVFQEGDLVLRKILPLLGKNQRKWAPNYESIYRVKKASLGELCCVTRMDGGDLPRPVNSDFVKKYYV
jgi:hypothetical protein